MAHTRFLTAFAAVLLFVGEISTSTAQEKNGRSAAEHARKGVEHAQKGFHEAALREFSTAIGAEPGDARLYLDRGGLHMTLRRFRNAASDAAKAIELAPKDHAGYSLRGAALTQLNEFAAALRDLNKALELQPDDPHTLLRRGDTYLKEDKLEEALADYSNAITRSPEYTAAFSRRADAYVRMKRFEEAKADLEKVLALRPEDISAQGRLDFLNARVPPRTETSHGVVRDVVGTTATITASGGTPAIGDSVEIFFKLADTEDEVSVANGTVISKDGEAVKVEIRSGTGEVTKNQLARFRPRKATLR